jgi:Putative zinc-finger
MNRDNHHTQFEELCALANTGTLTAAERLELDRHLAGCAECRVAYHQYERLATESIPVLASIYAHPQETEDWHERSARRALFVRIRNAEESSLRGSGTPAPPIVLAQLSAAAAWSAWIRVAVAACIVAGVGYGSYRLASRPNTSAKQFWPASTVAAELAEKKDSVDKLLVSQADTIALLEQRSVKKQSELDALHAAWKTLEDHSQELASQNSKSAHELASITAERGALVAQLSDAQREYEDVQKQLISVQGERDGALLRATSLESTIDELRAANKEQDGRLRDDEQYLAADRDIRELMGARNLYIADVFDVDSGSRTRKPFGRVFYTENKSLIFYAFDLDRQPGIKNAAFQVWGQKDAAQGEKAHPLNLGILYMDSESNRRWVLRLDDPKQLPEIDAVFVTVEPHGGSRKPTSKPFLYALLRKEANHP